MNLFKKLFLNLVVFCGVVSGVWAQTTPCNSNSEEMKNLRATQFSHFPKVTASEQGLIYLDTARRDNYATYTATNDVTGAVYTGVFDTTLGVVVVNVGALTQDATFTIKAEMGACSYTLAEKAVFQIATQPELVARVSHEYCANGGGIYYHLVGGANPADYDVKMRYHGNEITFISDHFISLSSGDFTLVATPKVAGVGGNLQTTGEILNKKKEIKYNVYTKSGTSCANRKTDIVIDVTQGSFPMRYEIIEGPQTFGEQDSPIFKDLEPGEYKVRVSDFCGTGVSGGNGVTQVIVVYPPAEFSGRLKEPLGLNFSNKIYAKGCLNDEFVNQLEIAIETREVDYSRDSYLYPFVLTRRFVAPSGRVYEYSHTIEKRGDLDNLLKLNHTDGVTRTMVFNPIGSGIVAEHNGEWHIEIKATSCGTTTSIVDEKREVNDLSFVNYYQLELRRECKGNSRTFIYFNFDQRRFEADRVLERGREQTIILDQFPACFNPLKEGFYRENGQWRKYLENNYDPFVNIEDTCQGHFQFRIEDPCGNVSRPYTIDVAALTSLNVEYEEARILEKKYLCEGLEFGIYAGSEKGNSSVRAYFSSVKLLSFDGDASKLPNGIAIGQEIPNAVGTTAFKLDNMPFGTYEFEYQYFCDSQTHRLREEVAKPILANVTWDYRSNCVLEVKLDYSGDVKLERYYLQWFNKETNSWVYPKRIKPANDANAEKERLYIEKGSSLVLDANFYSEGEYRVVAHPHESADCYIQVGDTYKLPEKKVPVIKSVIGIQCNQDTYRVALIVEGGRPDYKYYLTKEGATIYEVPNVNPGKISDDGNVFFNINARETGTFHFRVFDQCGEAGATEKTISQMIPFDISLDKSTHCVDSRAVFSVPYMSIVNYKWYDKDDVSKTSLSDKNTFVIDKLEAHHFNKTYVVEVTSKNGSDTCVNKTLEKQLTISTENPVDLTGVSQDLDICVTELEANAGVYSAFNLKEKLFPTAPNGGVLVEETSTISVPNSHTIDMLHLKEFFRGSSRTFVYRVTNACGLVSEAKAVVRVKDFIREGSKIVQICKGMPYSKSLDDIANEVKAKHPTAGITSVQWYYEQGNILITNTSERLNPSSNTNYVARIAAQNACFDDFRMAVLVLPSPILSDETINGCEGITAGDIKDRIIEKVGSYSRDKIKIFLKEGTVLTELPERHELTFPSSSTTPIEYWYQVDNGTCPSDLKQIKIEDDTNTSLISNFVEPAQLQSGQTIGICETDTFAPITFKGEGVNLVGIWEKMENGRWRVFTENTTVTQQGNVYTHTFTPNKSDISSDGNLYRFTLKGCNQKSKQFDLKIFPKLIDTFDYTDAEVCNDRTLTLEMPQSSWEVSYQWYENSVNSEVGATKLFNETNSTLRVAYTSPGDRYYFVKMKYRDSAITCPEVTSRIKKVTMVDVTTPLALGTLDIDGDNLVHCLNENVTLTATHNNKPAGVTFRYQWYREKNNIPEVIDGATSLTYTIDTSVASEYTYKIKAFVCAAEISDTAEVKITDFKGKYNFDNKELRVCLNGFAPISFTNNSGIQSFKWYESSDENKTTITEINITTPQLNATTVEAGTRYYFVRMIDDCNQVKDTPLKKVIVSNERSVEYEPIARNWAFCQNAPADESTIEVKVPAGSNYTFQWYEQKGGGIYQPITGATTNRFVVPTSSIGDYNYRLNIIGCEEKQEYFQVRVGNNDDLSEIDTDITTCDPTIPLYRMEYELPLYHSLARYEWLVSDTDDFTQAQPLSGILNYHLPNNQRVMTYEATQTAPVKYYFLKGYHKCNDNVGTNLGRFAVTLNQGIIDVSDFRMDVCDAQTTLSAVKNQLNQRLRDNGLNPDDYIIKIIRDGWEDITNENPDTKFDTDGLYHFSIEDKTGTMPCNAEQIKLVFNVSKTKTKITKGLRVTKQNYCLGETPERLQVEAEGHNNNLYYKWYRYDISMQAELLAEGQGMTSYQPQADRAGEWYYVVEVIGECGSKQSGIHLYYSSADSQISPPKPMTVCVGSQKEIYVEVLSGTNLRYQWYQNTTNSNQGGTLLYGATDGRYVKNYDQEGTYYFYVEVIAPCGQKTTSEVFEVNVINTIETLSAEMISYCNVSELDADTIVARIKAIAEAKYNGVAWGSEVIYERGNNTPIIGQLLDPTKEYDFEFLPGDGTNCTKRIPLKFSDEFSIVTQPLSSKICDIYSYVQLITNASNPSATYQWYRNTTESTTGAEVLTQYQQNQIFDSLDNVLGVGQNKAYFFAVISDACGHTLTTDIVSVERGVYSTTPVEITKYIRKGATETIDVGTTYRNFGYDYFNQTPNIVKLLSNNPPIIEAIELGTAIVDGKNPKNATCSDPNLKINIIVWDIEAKADEYKGNSKEDKVFDDTIIKEDLLNNVENPSLNDVEIKVKDNTADLVVGTTTEYKLLQQNATTQPNLAPILDITTGKVSLPKGTPSGIYTLQYQLTYKPAGEDSDFVEVKVLVTNELVANEDNFTTDKDNNAINGNKTTYTQSVLDNDKFNDDTFKNVPENKSNITLSVVEGATPLTTGAKVPTLVITPATGSTEEVGQIKVEADTPAGTYKIKYKICENGALPENCQSTTATIVVTALEIVAKPNKYTTDPDDNTSPIIGNKETILPSILDNDKLNDNELDTDEEKEKVKIEVKTGTTTPVTGSTTEVKLLQEGVTTQPDKAPVLNTETGVIVVPQGTPAGTYTLKYKICEVVNAETNCSKEVEVKVVVTALEIVATANHFTQNPADNTKPISSEERTELPSILDDDTLGGKLLDGKQNNLSADKVKIEVETGTATELPSGNYTLTPPSGVTTTTLPELNTSTGVIVVPQGTPAGTYTLRYRISEVLNPSNQSEFVDVSVVVDKIVTEPITKVVGRDKGDNFSILDKIKVDNQTPNISNITITDTTTPTSTGKTPKLDPTTGKVKVEKDTPAGEYDLTYKVCTTEGICTTGTIKVKVIEANDDSITNVNGNQNNPDVLDILGGRTPDKVGTLPATLNTNADSDVTIKVVPTASSPTQDETGTAVKLTPADTKFDTKKPYPTLNTETGKVSVPQGTPAGTYTLKYQICREGVCDEAEVSVEVKGINANPDIFKNINGTTGTDNAGNVVTNNDTLNGNPITDITKVAISVLTPATPNTGSTLVPTLDTTTGIVSVPAGTPSGDYTIKYQICDVANAGRCSDAEVKVEVRNPIVATNDRVTIDGNKGGTSVSVLGNDTLSGTTPSIKTQVDISVVTPATSVVGAKNDLVPTLKIDTDNDIAQVEVPQGTPAGTYTITYRICERNADPENCKDATITIEVTGDCELTFYNAISTNGDASNDTFVIEGIECYPDNELKIFNRWGVLVYEQKGYDQSFRGYSNGRVTINRDEPLPNGTYYYIFEYRNSEGETKRKAGWLYKSN